MKMDLDANASFASRISDARRGLVDLAPGHSVNICTCRSDIQHQGVRRALLRAERPTPFKGCCLGISPSSNFAALWTLYSDGRIMSKLQRIAFIKAHRVMNQDA